MFNHKITYYLMLSVAMLLSLTLGLSSCVYDDYPEVETQNTDPTVDPNAYNVSFLLNVGNAETRSDPTYSEGTEQGNDEMYENYIDLEKGLKLYFYGLGSNDYGFLDNQIQELTLFSAVKVTGYTNLYRITATLDPQNIPTGSFRFIIMANCHNNTAEWDSSKVLYYNLFQNSMWKYPVESGGTSWKPYKDFPIPMYGVKNFVKGKTEGFPDFVKGMTADLGVVNMLRSVAKIEVLSKRYEASPVTIEDLKLTKFLPLGAAAPKLMLQEDTHQPTTATLIMAGEESTVFRDYVKSLGYSTYGSANCVAPYENLSFLEDKSDTEYYHYYAYVPEYRNIYYDSNRVTPGAAKITFRVKTNNNPDGRDCELEFKNYVTNVAFDIFRNNIYRYYVDFNDVNVTDIKYVVEPWTELTAGDIIFE